MSFFDARLRVKGERGLPLGVEIDLNGDRMVVSAAGGKLADWALGEISISSLPDGFHVEAEGEEVVLNVTDRARFVSEVGSRLRR